ncbi:MAG: hypothetical protein QOG89_521 [Thermomicrobiales bacterium]|nr:hypothetical protein [Thermomicrobiales bacterium]
MSDLTRKIGDGLGLAGADVEAGRRIALLVEHFGFTHDEAIRYVGGDRAAIEKVAQRRMAGDIGSDSPTGSSGAMATPD